MSHVIKLIPLAQALIMKMIGYVIVISQCEWVILVITRV